MANLRSEIVITSRCILRGHDFFARFPYHENEPDSLFRTSHCCTHVSKCCFCECLIPLLSKRPTCSPSTASSARMFWESLTFCGSHRILSLVKCLSCALLVSLFSTSACVTKQVPPCLEYEMNVTCHFLLQIDKFSQRNALASPLCQRSDGAGLLMFRLSPSASDTGVTSSPELSTEQKLVLRDGRWMGITSVLPIPRWRTAHNLPADFVCMVKRPNSPAVRGSGG